MSSDLRARSRRGSTHWLTGPSFSLLVVILLLLPGPAAGLENGFGDGHVEDRSSASSSASDGPSALAAAVLQRELRHTELRESRPAADSTVTETVREVLLIFTTAVQADLSSITVRGPDGMPVSAGPVTHPTQAERDHLVVRFDFPLPSGTHEVEWRTVAPDGHVVEGVFSFQVAADEPEADPAQAQDPPIPPAELAEPEPTPPDETGVSATLGLVPGGTGQRWLHLLGTVLLLGVVAFRFGVLGRGKGRSGLEGIAAVSRRGLARVAWVAVPILALTLATRLYHHLSQLGGGDGAAWEFLPVVLFRTGWGGGWFLHLAAVILAVTGLVVARRPGAEGRGWGILAGAAALLPLVPALQGHAMGSEARVLAIPVLYAHVGAVGVWLGGLLMLIVVGLPAVKRVGEAGGKLPPLARLVNAFSRVALLAVTLVVLSGATTAFLVGPGLGEIFGTTWGRTLLLKLAVLACAFFLGFYNWRKVRPALAKHPDPGTLRIPAMVEAVLGVVVLLITAALVATPLP